MEKKERKRKEEEKKKKKRKKEERAPYSIPLSDSILFPQPITSWVVLEELRPVLCSFHGGGAEELPQDPLKLILQADTQVSVSSEASLEKILK